MIDWELTNKTFGRHDLSGSKPLVIVKCDTCGVTRQMAIYSKKKVKDNQWSWQCRKCISNRPEMVASGREGAKKAWANPEYREKLSKHLDKLHADPTIMAHLTAYRESPEFKAQIAEINKRKVTAESRANGSKAAKLLWTRDGYREKMSKIFSTTAKRLWSNNEYRERVTNGNKRVWLEPGFKLRGIEATRRLWTDDEYRAKVTTKLRLVCNSDDFIEKMRRRWDDAAFREKMRSQPRVSSLQLILYSMLDDLNVKYYRERDNGVDDLECSIGPYSFDCVIPRPGKTALLIECNGDYWHNKPKVERKDRAKQSYIANNFSDKYEIKALWEHEFKNHQRVVETVKYWLGITDIPLVEYNFIDLTIKPCPADDYRLLLSKYHYIHNAGRGGHALGAYLGEELIAVCIFSPLPRQNIKIEAVDEVKELSRLCIHPSYRKPNLASWFITRCIKSLPDNISTIISYCDTTFNHNGATYKACNFINDHIVPSDYWYVTEDGWATHKKTLYNHAVRMGVTESEYAKKHDYKKVWGKEKLRFIFRR